MSKRALSLHVTLAIVLPSFGALTWWQVRRAISGNTLSYVYSFEWPLFAAYAVYLWWKLIHEAPTEPARPDAVAGGPETAPLSNPPAGPEPVPQGSRPVDDQGSAGSRQELVDDELAAYNRYLAELAESGERKQLFSGRRGRRRSQKQET